MTYSYLYILFGTGLIFSIAERLWPRIPGQKFFRKGLLLDLGLAILNAEILAAWIAGLIANLYQPLGAQPLQQWWIARQSIWVQAALLFVCKDFVQFLVHNLLHRVPLFWRFHRLHHSTEEMDWLSNWRFNGLESFAYQLALYVPSLWLGFSAEAAFICAIASTTLSHFAHANLNWKVGPLRYLFNCPELHIWHHAHPETGVKDVNFGISLSLWDWLFRTAYSKGDSPHRIGC